MSAADVTPEALAEDLRVCREVVAGLAPGAPYYLRLDARKTLSMLEELLRLRAEVQRLTEEARRSDAGRVEVPELTDTILDLACGPDLSGKVDLPSVTIRDLARMQYRRGWEDLANRLSCPAPPAAVVTVPVDQWITLRDMVTTWYAGGSINNYMHEAALYWPRNDVLFRYVSAGPKPVVTVPREEWEAYQTWEKAVRGVAFGMSRENECLATLDALRSGNGGS